jgi:hypothetical protein
LIKYNILISDEWEIPLMRGFGIRRWVKDGGGDGISERRRCNETLRMKTMIRGVGRVARKFWRHK